MQDFIQSEDKINKDMLSSNGNIWEQFLLSILSAIRRQHLQKRIVLQFHFKGL